VHVVRTIEGLSISELRCQTSKMEGRENENHWTVLVTAL
jgi:hypothetical protein